MELDIHAERTRGQPKLVAFLARPEAVLHDDALAVS
jgi:hypothetical protein